MAQPSTDREPTPDERRNGWTRETLARYLAQRQQEQQAFATAQEKNRGRKLRVENTVAFDPLTWGK
jgi:hypothetical protein